MRVRTMVLFLVGICLLSAILYILERPTHLETMPVQVKFPRGKPGSAEWVTSAHGDLSLRLRVKSERISAKESIFVIAEIRNDSKAPLTILRPFGDGFADLVGKIDIWDQESRIEYSGPIYDYDLNADAFVTLAAGEIVTNTLELSIQDFAGSDRPGAYAVRYKYEYSGTWDQKVAGEGVKGIWHGAVTSREVSLLKE